VALDEVSIKDPFAPKKADDDSKKENPKIIDHIFDPKNLEEAKPQEAPEPQSLALTDA